MKKQITLLTLAVLFTGACLNGETEITMADLKPAEAVAATPVKKSWIPTVEQCKTSVKNHPYLVTGMAAGLGFIILWKTCPAFRALFGVEDEQEQEKLVVF